MEYKILEQNGIENENVDGAGFNNFCAGNRDGIIKGILNECSVYSPASNSIGISTGELLIKGFRLKLTQPYLYNFTSNAGVDIRYHIVAVLTLSLDRFVSINIVCRPVQPLIKEEIFKVEQGTYETELVRFTHTANGITDIVKVIDVIVGGNSKATGITIGQVTTENISSGMDAEVDSENVERNGRIETDFHFSIPSGSSTELDTELSSTSENAVQNKVITSALDGKLDILTGTSGVYRLYGVANDGKTPMLFSTASSNNSGFIAQYGNPNLATSGTTDRGGALTTTKPKNPYHATNKDYVDTETKLYRRTWVFMSADAMIITRFTSISRSDVSLLGANIPSTDIVNHLNTYYKNCRVNIYNYNDNTEQSYDVANVNLVNKDGRTYIELYVGVTHIELDGSPQDEQVEEMQ